MIYDILELEEAIQTISPYILDEEGAQEDQVTWLGTPQLVDKQEWVWAWCPMHFYLV